MLAEADASTSAPPADRPGSAVRTVVGWSVVGLVVFSAVAIGTVHPVTRLVVFGGAAVLLAASLAERSRRGGSLAIPPPALALALAAGATALQLVPLPAGVIASLSPTTDEVLRSALGQYETHPLSLDPAGSVAELAKLTAYLVFFLTAVGVSSRSRWRRRIVFSVALLATAIALLALVEQAAGTNKVLFFYRPNDDWAGHFRGTFVNPNHFGALMVLGAPCALWLGLVDPQLRKAAWVAVLVMNAAAVLSFSRSALVFVPLAQLAALGLDRLFRRGSGASARWWLGIAVVAGVAVAFAVGGGTIASRLVGSRQVEIAAPFSNPFSKFHEWPNVVQLIREYPLTGVGRGAFEQAFPRFSDAGGFLRFSHVENGYLQALADWGVPVCLALGFLAWRGIAVAWRGVRRDPTGVAPFAAIAVLALHETVDFAMEVPGVALPALALLATLYGGRATAVRTVKTRPRHLALPVYAGLVMMLAWLTPSAAEAGAALAARARDPSVPTAAVVLDGERARAEHPSDYYIDALVAERLVRDGNGAALHWLNAAIYLNPTHPTLHLFVAELLARSGHKSQAILEYHLAMESTTNPVEVWARAVRYYPALDDLLAMTPETTATRMAFGDWLVGKERPVDAEKVYQDALARDAGSVELQRRLLQTAVRSNRPELAVRRARALVDADRSTGSRLAAAEALIGAGVLDEAAAVLDAPVERTRQTFLLELALAERLVAAGRLGEARARLDRLTWWHDRDLLVRLHEIRAELERRDGNEHQQRWELEQAERFR